MENSKLITLFRTFAPADLRALTDFVRSPYFNKREDLSRLFCYLKEVAGKGFTSDQLQRRAIFNAVYPEAAFDDRQLNYASSQLLKLLERFISIHGFEEDGVQSECYLLEYYLRNDLHKHFSFVHRRACKRLEQVKGIKESKLHQEVQLADLADWHFAQQKKRHFDVNLQHASDRLDAYYLSKKIRYLCEMLDRQRGIAQHYRPNLLAEIKKHLQLQDYPGQPLIRIYRTLLFSFSEGEEGGQYFRRFKTLLFEYEPLFTQRDLKALYFFGINYCVIQFTFGNKGFAKDLMDLYKNGIDNQVLQENGFISPWTFKNVVKLGLGLKRLGWTKEFIEDYAHQLPDNYREDAMNFNLAQVDYFLGDFDSALLRLHRTKFDDIYYNMDAKAMLARIYFETDENEALDSLLAAFYIYLKRRSDIPRNVKTPYYNFIRFLQALQKGPGKYNRGTLREKISNTKSLSAKSWLLSRLD